MLWGGGAVGSVDEPPPVQAVIGPLEILILVLILLILFGGYKRLPQFGRSAGTGARKGGEKAKQLAGQVREKAEGVDTSKIGESVGKGFREARDVRDAVKGTGGADSPKSEASEPDSQKSDSQAAERPSGD